MSKLGHECDVFNRREVPCNRNGTLPDGNREAFVARHFYKEAAGPKKRSGSFIRHSHGVTREGLYKTSLRAYRLTGCDRRLASIKSNSRHPARIE